jgi:DNA processing protein
VPTAPPEERYVPPAPHRISIVDLHALVEGLPSTNKDRQARLSFDGVAQVPLWYAGDLSLVQRKSVSIVGTRAVSPEGAARARRLARELAQAGIVVVSGLARGVDTEALTAAISAGGRVIAVIGTPLDKAYPAENKRVQEKIYSEHLLISQFPSGQRVFQSNFPERNKLMAALSGATVIIEAGETSGTLHQAAECVRLDRWLFIAKSVLENPALQWPAKFRDYPKVSPLSETQDILSVL